MNNKKYKKFIFFSAGPVGDHALLIEYANRFFESSGIESLILLKHPSQFLKDFSIPYNDHIEYLDFNGVGGLLKMFVLSVKSLLNKYCYVLVLPIPPPTYFKFFAYFIRFFSRSRFVGFNLEGSRNFPIGYGSAYFLGRKNFIPSNLDKELFYEQANRMLGFLGYEPVEHTPVLKYVDSDEVLKRVGVEKQNYIVFHLCSSHPDRSLPLDRWQKILLNVREKFPDLKFVFTGSVADKKFINEVLNGLNLKNTLIACGERSQDLLNIYAKAKLNITVHTGNAILINELHVPTIILNIKGIYMFKYYFNEKSTELVATEGCRCDPYERDCALVEYKGQGYMACLFNIKDQDVVDTIVKKLVI